MPDVVAISELLEIDPDRVDAVSSPANGTEWLILKAIDNSETIGTTDDVIAELTKADDDMKCDKCDGTGKMDDAKCSKCRGTGMMPKVGMSEKELADAAQKEHGVAPSGAPVPVRDKCPTCNGSGTLMDGGGECPDCDGSGHDSTQPPSDKLNRVDADLHSIHEGDAAGREAIDKSVDLYDDDIDEDLEKAKLTAKTRNALPDSAFALPGRRYPIHDESHARNALARVAQNGTPDEIAKVKAAVKRKFPDIEVDGDATKADGSVLSGANPNLSLAGSMSSDDGSGDDDTDASSPGSPAWEAVDAQTALDAATALAVAAELIRTFANREDIEVAAGEGSDVFDSYAATSALANVTQAIGVMATLAFHEGLEAAKSLDDDEVATKSGKRLSTKSVAALAAARDHITNLLGDDDPAMNDDNDDAATKSVAIDMDKLSKELENMETDELSKVLDARDEKLVGLFAEAMKAMSPKQDIENTDSTSNAKTANAKAKNKKPKAENKDLEDEAEQGDHDSANTSPKGAAKSEGDEIDDEVDAEVEAEVEKSEDEMTEAEIAAKAAIDEAKQILKDAKKAQKQAAQDAAVAKEIREGIAEATSAFETLQDRLGTVDELKARLATVEKNVAPGGPVRSAPPEEAAKSRQRSLIEMEASRLESLARNTNDREVRKAYEDRARDELAKLSDLDA